MKECGPSDSINNEQRGNAALGFNEQITMNKGGMKPSGRERSAGGHYPLSIIRYTL